MARTSTKTTLQKRANGAHDDPAEAPVFDFHNLSWGENRRYQHLQHEMRRITLLLDQDETLLDDAKYQAALEAEDRAWDELDARIALVLVSVPRAWLVDGAPDEIDWSDPASLRWLSMQSMRLLREEMGKASQVERASGNSAGRSS